MRSRRRGFTLLEVLVATTIMAVAVATLLSALSTSLLNASRVTDSDLAAMLARRTMDELLSTSNLPRGQVIEGRFDRRVAGLDGGWRALVSAFEPLPGKAPAEGGIDRVALEVYWSSGQRRRVFQLEGYRKAVLTGGPQW